MMPSFLVPETVVRAAGSSSEIDLGESRGGMVLVTLGITRIIEQESLDISIWGSADNVDYGSKPLLSFPQKFYCGVYQMILDLAAHPEIRYLKAKWNVNRWGRGGSEPLFGIYVFVQDASRQIMAMTA
jgi:hypothetical protein